MIDLSVLKNISGAKKYSHGTVIAADGSRSEMHIVLKGDVGVFSNAAAKPLVATAGPGSFFGETALLPDTRTPFAYTALTDVIVLPVPRDKADAFFEDEPKMAFELFKEICLRLHEVSEAYQQLHGHPWIAPAPLAAPTAPQPTTEAAAPLAAPAEDAPPSAAFPLFPEEHGCPQLPPGRSERAYLLNKSHTCPVCRQAFSSPAVKVSKLIVESTDNDLRHHYQGIEPLYYDVVTCPGCLYSALTDMFDRPDKPQASLRQELQALKPYVTITSGAERDAFSVFAGYYLALFCAPRCFTAHRLATAKLLLKLSRLYQDCADRRMEEETVRRARSAYMHLFEHADPDPAQDQQIYIIIGELSLKLGDLKTAKDFFFRAKTNRAGAPVLKKHAQNRLQDIRDTEGTG